MHYFQITLKTDSFLAIVGLIIVRLPTNGIYELNFLYWNTNKKNIIHAINEFVDEHEIDFLILSEPFSTSKVFLESINENRKYKFTLPFSPINDSIILVRMPNSSVVGKVDNQGLSIKHVIPPIGKDFILALVHLPSKLYYLNEDQAAYASEIVKEIEVVEKVIGHRRTIVVGDFNMNPFENGMVNAFGFHAIMDRKVVCKKSRIIKGVEKHFFYNPMWNQFGKKEGLYGTFYYQIAKPLSYYWNMFDQVIIRPDLLELFDDSKLSIQTKSKNINLLSAKGIPEKNSFSDHLPITFCLDLI